MSQKQAKQARRSAKLTPVILAPDGTPAREKPEVIHRRQFMHGRMSVEEMNTRLVRRKCDCGAWGVGYIRVFMLAEDFARKNPIRANAIRVVLGLGKEDPIPSFDSKWGRLMQVSSITPCSNCFPAAERAAAHEVPDDAYVEITRGNTTKISSAVSVQLERPAEATAAASLH
jgi:hypothetical protein